MVFCARVVFKILQKKKRSNVHLWILENLLLSKLNIKIKDFKNKMKQQKNLGLILRNKVRFSNHFKNFQAQTFTNLIRNKEKSYVEKVKS